MKKRSSACASALQIVLSAALISISVILVASSFNAAPSRFGIGASNRQKAYDVTPTPLRDLQPVTDPIPDTGDALRVQVHFQSGGTLLTGCAELAAHVTGNVTVDIGDALAIQKFFQNDPRSPSNLTGQWRFIPASRSYADLTSDQSAQNYDAYVLGDVTGRVIFPQP